MSGDSSGLARERVGVNTASADELCARVKGLDEVLSRRIVDYREAHGPFTSLEQLVEVRGIGPKSVKGLTPQLVLYAPAVEKLTPEAELEVSGAIDEAMEETTSEAVEDAIEATEGVDEALDQAAASVGEEAAEEIEVFSVDAQVVADEASASAASAASAAIELTAAEQGDGPDLAVADLAEEDDERATLQTAEEVSQLAAQELESEVVDVEMAELGLYTRVSGSDPITQWSPPEDEIGKEAESEAPAVVAEAEGESELAEAEGESVFAEADVEADPIAVSAYAVAQEAGAAVSQYGATEERAMAQEAATMSGPVRTSSEEGSAGTERRRGGFWRSLGLVLLGGLLGVALTVAGAMIWSGTFDYAPRQEVDALSRNLNTMQANQELAWERVDQLTVGSEEMARKVKQIESFTGRIGDMEKGLAAAEGDLAAAKTTLGDLSKNLAELETSLETNMNKLDERVTLTEDQLGTMSTLVASLEETFGVVEERVQSIDGFFGSLRDLLIKLEGPAPAPTKAGVKTPEPTPKTGSSNK